MNTYDIGDLVRIRCSFASEGTPADPTTVKFRIKFPKGTPVGPVDVVKDSVGEYHYDYIISQSGVHKYRFEGTGAVIAAEEGSFMVRRSDVLS